MSATVFTIANQKGGVGKTTTAINLSYGLVERGIRTVLIDLDPQGNASTGLGIDRAARTTTSFDVLLGEARLGEARRRLGAHAGDGRGAAFY